jgi:hypothetical protein
MLKRFASFDPEGHMRGRNGSFESPGSDQKLIEKAQDS